PASFQLVMAANPCPCGVGMAGAGTDCQCTPLDKRRYRSRLSGPLLDRVDLQLELLPVSPADLRLGRAQETSESVAARVREAGRPNASRTVGGDSTPRPRAPGCAITSR